MLAAWGCSLRRPTARLVASRKTWQAAIVRSGRHDHVPWGMTFPTDDNVDAECIAERPVVNFVEPDRDGAKLRLPRREGGVRKCTEFRPSERLVASRCAGRHSALGVDRRSDSEPLMLLLLVIPFGLLWLLIAGHRTRLGFGNLSIRGALVLAFLAFEVLLLGITELSSVGTPFHGGHCGEPLAHRDHHPAVCGQDPDHFAGSTSAGPAIAPGSDSWTDTTPDR